MRRGKPCTIRSIIFYFSTLQGRFESRARDWVFTTYKARACQVSLPPTVQSLFVVNRSPDVLFRHSLSKTSLSSVVGRTLDDPQQTVRRFLGWSPKELQCFVWHDIFAPCGFSFFYSAVKKRRNKNNRIIAFFLILNKTTIINSSCIDSWLIIAIIVLLLINFQY